MLVTIKRVLFLPNTIILTILFLFVISFTPVLAANVLTNPSFTGGLTGWTISLLTYDSTNYQDTAGSLSGQTPIGRNSQVQGSATQAISTTIIGGSTVKLSLYYNKQCVAINCAINTITIQSKISGVTSDIWTNTTIPTAGSPIGWTSVSQIDVSSYFTATGSYDIIVNMNIRNGNNASAQTLAWVDNMNLDVVPPSVTVSTTGTQVATVNTGETGKYIGGAFKMSSNTGSINVNSIQISEAGTLNANTYLHNVKLFYETAVTCTYDANESQYGTTTSFNASEDATFTQTLAVTTSQICFYVVFDIDQNATDSASIEIEISNPSTDVTVASGYGSSPATTVAISGSTTVNTVASISISLTTDGSVTWGVMEANTTKSTLDITDTEVVQSDSNVNIDLSIKSSNAIGTTDWTLSSIAGNNLFVYEYSSNGGSGWNVFFLPDSYYSFVSAMTPSSTQNLDLRITTPTVSTDFGQKTITVTILASQS